MSSLIPLKNGIIIIRLAVCEDGEKTVREDSFKVVKERPVDHFYNGLRVFIYRLFIHELAVIAQSIDEMKVNIAWITECFCSGVIIYLLSFRLQGFRSLRR